MMTYKIDGDITPMPFQDAGIRLMLSRDKNLLCDEMGLGKTIQAAVTAYNKSKAAKLVICPASLKINWEREIHKLYPNSMVWIARTKTDYIPAGYDWYIVNYDLLSGLSEQLCVMRDGGIIDTMLIDEAHMIKNMGTRKKPVERTHHTLAIAKEMPVVLPITGSPILNRPSEGYTLLKAINHELGEMSQTSYESRYCGGRMVILRNGIRYWDNTGATNLTELQEKLKGVMIRRTKKEVLPELPEKTITQMPVELTTEWRRKYDTVWQEYIEQKMREPEFQELTQEEATQKLSDILGAQSIIELGKVKQVTSAAKTERVIKDALNIVDQGEKVIIFTQYTGVVENLLAAFKEKKIKAVSITGQHNQEQRQKAVDDFQKDPKTKVFVGNIKAAGVGITLTEASVVMFVDTEWSPEIQKQAEDRAHRIGQKNAVNIYYYVAVGTIDEDIMNLLQDKRVVIGAIVGGEQNVIKKSDIHN